MNPFQTAGLYRHKNCLDIDMFVIGEPEETALGTEAVVVYWNRRSKVIQGKSEKVLFKKEQYCNWSFVGEELQ
jgi:hypothetical protein